jgi:hypothetical protein
VRVNKFNATLILVLFLGLTACNLPSSQPATEDPYQAAALTVTALAGTEQAQASPTFTLTSASSTPLTTATSAPPASTAIIASSTPGGIFFVVDVGANCRTGPGTNYDRVTSFAQGSYVTPTGRNADSTWWYITSGSTNCWISAATGHTTGSVGGLPVVAAPPTPTVATSPATATAGPSLSDPVALVAELSYPSNCTSNIVSVAIRVTDNGNGVNSVWLSYRYLGDGGYVGNWHTVSPNNNAAGGINGFNYAIGTEAATELGKQNGTFQYQFFAKDNSGNTTSYPNGSVLGMPIKYCP